MIALNTAVTPPPAPEDSPVRDYLSFSAIRTYQNCPLRYYSRYSAGLPEKTVSASLVFGAGIHRAIERHFQDRLAGNEAPTLDEMLEVYGQEWAERGDEVQHIDDASKRHSRKRRGGCWPSSRSMRWLGRRAKS